MKEFYEKKLNNITSLLKSQEEQINILKEMLKKNNREIVLLKRKKKIKNIVYFLIFMFIFYYFNIFELMINCYNYYHQFLFVLDRITSFSESVFTINADIHQILENQKQLLDKMDVNQQKLLQQTFQNTMKDVSKIPFSTERFLNPSSFSNRFF